MLTNIHTACSSVISIHDISKGQTRDWVVDLWAHYRVVQVRKDIGFLHRGCVYVHAIWKPRAVCRLHRAVCRLHAMQSADCAATVSMNYMHVCALEDNFKENRENCHDFIVLYCVRNWEVISVVENLVRHNNRSFRANKLVIVSPNYKQENE